MLDCTGKGVLYISRLTPALDIQEKATTFSCFERSKEEDEFAK